MRAQLLQDRFLVLYGDVFIECDLARLWADHANSRALATLVVHPNDHPYDSDLVEADAEGWISAIHPKSRPENQYLPNIVNAGVAVIERKILASIPPGQHLDLASDIFPALARDGRPQGLSLGGILQGFRDAGPSGARAFRL